MRDPHPKLVPQVIAHRGCAVAAPENSLQAFEDALELGVDGLELDVQLSLDEVPVIYHDHTLDRAGQPGRRVGELPWAELRHLHFATVPHVTAPGPLCTLEDVLNGFGHRTALWIELKSRPQDRADGSAGRLARCVLALLEARGLVDRVHILSFDLELLYMVHLMEPRLRCCWNMEDGAELLEASPGTVTFLWGIGIRTAMLTAEVAALAQALRLVMYAFVVNDACDLQLALKHRVGNLISDRPWEIRELLGEWGTPHAT